MSRPAPCFWDMLALQIWGCFILTRASCPYCTAFQQMELHDWQGHRSAPGCRYCFEANALLAAALAALGFELFTVAGRWAWFMMLQCTVRQHAHQSFISADNGRQIYLDLARGTTDLPEAGFKTAHKPAARDSAAACPPAG